MRTPRPARHRLPLCLAPVVLLVACGQERGTTAADDAPTASPPTATSPSSPAPSPTATSPTGTSPTGRGTGSAPSADLTVTWDDGGGTGATWTLTCGPTAAAGDHPDPGAACAALSRAATALDPLPRDVACTEIYGGPQTATVTGTLDGSAVTAALSRTNGCEIDRWESLVPLLPAAATGT